MPAPGRPLPSLRVARFFGAKRATATTLGNGPRSRVVRGHIAEHSKRGVVKLLYPFRARQGLVPALPSKHLPRPRLVAALESAVEGNPLTLICAGPASGKTVLLTEWSRSKPRRLVWVSLDPADNSPAAFWTLVGSLLPDAQERRKRMRKYHA